MSKKKFKAPVKKAPNGIVSKYGMPVVKALMKPPGDVTAIRIIDIGYNQADMCRLLSDFTRETHGVDVPHDAWTFDQNDEGLFVTAKLTEQNYDPTNIEKGVVKDVDPEDDEEPDYDDENT